MPLRDHFRPPLADRKSWDGFHGQWPAMIVLTLSNLLPQRYAAAPNIHLGSSIEVDVGAFDDVWSDTTSGDDTSDDEGVTTAVWAPPEPTLVVATDLLDLDEYEVLVYDTHPIRRLVAAIEIVSPSNKDRPEHRRAFVAKCAGLLHDQVSVTIIDLVTTRHANLYEELHEFIGQPDSSPSETRMSLYAATSRWVRRNGAWNLESWVHKLSLGETLPTLPVWLTDHRAIPLELEQSYEETCRVLRIS